MREKNLKSRLFSRRQRRQALGALAPRFSLAIDAGQSDADQYFMRLPFRRSWLLIGIFFVVLQVFSVPLYMVGGSLVDNPDGSLFSLVGNLFSLFWLLGWSVGVGILALVFLILLLGRETLRVRNGKLILRIGLLGIGFGASFDASLIRNFRAVASTADKSSTDGNWWRGDHLAFDYGEEKIHFGSALSVEAGRTLRQQLAQLFPLHQSPVPAQEKARLQESNSEFDVESEAAAPLRKTATAETLGSMLDQQDISGLNWISTPALVLANLMPVVGVLLYGWNVGEIMLLYWAESAIIGYYNLLKMRKIGGWAVLIYGPFFVGHYGAFMVGHLLFIYGFFASTLADSGDVTTQKVLADFVRLSPALLGLLISHGISYYVNFQGRREHIGKTMAQQMGEPYRRIIIMHITIIFGGFLVMAFDTAMPALLLMILLKLVADVRAHRVQHRPNFASGIRLSDKADPAMP